MMILLLKKLGKYRNEFLNFVDDAMGTVDDNEGFDEGGVEMKKNPIELAAKSVEVEWEKFVLIGDSIRVRSIVVENRSNLPDSNLIAKRKVEIVTMGSDDRDFSDHFSDCTERW